MSEGLKFLGSVCESGSRTALVGAENALFTDIELPAVEFIRSHVSRYGELPARQTVAAETGLALPAPREAMGYYEDQLRERHVFNLVRDRLQPFQDAYRHRNMPDMQAAVASMHEAARMHTRRDRDVLNISEAGELVMQRLASTRFTGGLTGALTGRPMYDAITGGYQNSDIITIVARPGIGKTWDCLNQARYSYREDRQSVLVVTTEMGTEALARRFAAVDLGINPTLLKRNMISTYTERRIGNMFREMQSADNLRIFSVGMNSKVSAIAALCYEYRPSIVFIDGVYLLQPSNVAKQASRAERITYVFDELKALNLEMNVPFVVTTQFNRAAGKGGKEGSLETIGYTDAIGTHSSVIVALREGPTENPRHSRSHDFLKGREGETGVTHTNFQFAPLNMSEIPYNPETGRPDVAGEFGEANTDWMA